MPELKIARIIEERIEKVPNFRVKHCQSCGEKIFSINVNGKSVTVDCEMLPHKEYCTGGRNA